MRKTTEQKKKVDVNSIIESLSPEDLLEMANEPDEDEFFYIWDKVQLIHDLKNKVYTIYSYTTYADWRVNFTVWDDWDYEMYEPWQIKKHIPPASIWFNNQTLWLVQSAESPQS